MTRKDCGAAGGAIIMWVRVDDCPYIVGYGGIISSYGPSTGFRIDLHKY